jgi:hypothetical protein
MEGWPALRSMRRETPSSISCVAISEGERRTCRHPTYAISFDRLGPTFCGGATRIEKFRASERPDQGDRVTFGR